MPTTKTAKKNYRPEWKHCSHCRGLYVGHDCGCQRKPVQIPGSVEILFPF